MNKFNSILALDTALNYCSVGIYTGGKKFVETQAMAQGHAEHLLPMAERVLKQAGIAYADLGAIAVTRGPGAFTGLRIALSTARALALALGIPVYGITTTQLLALQAVREKPEKVAVILETKRQDFYWQAFDGQGKAVNEAQACPGSEIDVSGSRLVGDGVERFNSQVPDLAVPDVGLMAELLATQPDYFTEGAEPVYLRGADVTESKRQNRIFEGSIG